MSIPVYPQFNPLEFSDLPAFTTAFRMALPVISEFTFTNLYSWRNAYKLSVSVLDNFIICSSDAQSGKRFFDPIGEGARKAVIEKLLRDYSAKFMRIPESTKILFDQDARFVCEPDRDNADYLYNRSDLLELAGRKYDGKRNLIKKFKAQNVYEYLVIDQGNAELCRDFVEAWCLLRNCDGVEGLNNERQAIQEMVGNFSSFGLFSGALRLRGQIRAVAIAQRLNDSTLVMHVLKAETDIPGLYQTMLQEFISRQTAGFQFVNLEQDLGIEGLRKAKLSYHPCEMVNKYILSLK